MSDGARIIEVIGLAGSGKSTSCRLLRECAADAAPLYRLARGSALAASSAGLAWIATHVRPDQLADPGGGWQGVRLVLHMQAMLRDLGIRSRRGAQVFFLDQGPVYNCASAQRLARAGELQAWVPARMRALLMARLDVFAGLVHLDAPEPVLLARVEQRAQEHRIKGAGNESAREFLAEYRSIYDSLFEEIAERAAIEALEVDSERLDPAAVCDAILSHFGVERRDGSDPQAVAAGG